MDIQQLESLGLTQNESKVYLSLVKLGKVPVIKIIQETGFHRNIVYDNLKKLLEKGVVSSLKKEKKTYFDAAPPNSLLDMLENRQRELNNKKEIARNLIKEITKLKITAKQKEEFTLYEGYKGVISVLELILKENKEILTTGASVKLVEDITNYQKYFFPRWHQERINRKIFFKILYGEDMRKRGKELSKLKYSEVKYIPEEFTSPVSLATVGTNISVIITWGKSPTALWIKSNAVTKGFRNYFETIWKLARL